jgi:ABC-2 type transport system ATP-binding protein
MPRPEAVLALQPLLEGEAHVSHDGRRLRAAVRNQDGLATAVVRALDRAGILVDDVQVHQPSLDDVFLALTGRESAGEETAAEPEEATA